MKNECSLKDIIVEIEKDFVLIPGKSGDEIMDFADEVSLSRFFAELEFLEVKNKLGALVSTLEELSNE